MVSNNFDARLPYEMIMVGVSIIRVTDMVDKHALTLVDSGPAASELTGHINQHRMSTSRQAGFASPICRRLWRTLLYVALNESSIPFRVVD
jgi:hypothetical protein